MKQIFENIFSDSTEDRVIFLELVLAFLSLVVFSLAITGFGIICDTEKALEKAFWGSDSELVKNELSISGLSVENDIGENAPVSGPEIKRVEVLESASNDEVDLGSSEKESGEEEEQEEQEEEETQIIKPAKPIIKNIPITQKPNVKSSKYIDGNIKTPTLSLVKRDSQGRKVWSTKGDDPHESYQNKSIHIDKECCLDPDEIPNPKCYYPKSKYGKLLDKYEKNKDKFLKKYKKSKK